MAAGACMRCGAPLDAMPGIDLSQLTMLDDRGVDVAGRPPRSFAPPPQAVAPASPAFAHAPRTFVPRPDAFGPPPDAFADAGDAEGSLGVERSTRAIRIESQWQVERDAKQVAAAAPVPRPRGPIAGVVVALGLIAAVAIALVMFASR